MSYNPLGGIMNPYRNDYVEVCVYCHTPHGANSTAAAPLWNRTINKPSQYQLYSAPTQLGQPVSTPGPSSLTCLSCHDGFTAIDSIINMPTQKSGAFAGYSKSQETSVGFGFLNQWDASLRGSHSALRATGDGVGPCYTCHNPNPPTANTPDFGPFIIGQKFFGSSNETSGDPTQNAVFETVRDLTGQGGYLADDHPIGVRYPEQFGPNVDYNEPTVKEGRIAYWDDNGNRHADPSEIRLYDSGEGYEVECASCHDPHGVRISESNDRLIPSFLRKGAAADSQNFAQAVAGAINGRGNAGSELCLTCHLK